MVLILASNTQSAYSSAFGNVRSSLLSTAESTSGFANSSGNPHDEDFMDAETL